MPEQEHQGKIKWYDAKKGFGFIVGYDGSDIFFHLRSLVEITAEQLVPEYPITFTLSKGKNDKIEATRVSPAKVEAMDLLSAIIGRNEFNYNIALLDKLLDGISQIKDESAYRLALQVLNYSKGVNLLTAAQERCFRMADDEYRLKLWLNGHLEFCDLSYLARTFGKAPPTYQKQIVKRLNQYGSSLVLRPPKVLFKHIQAQLLKEIAAAKYRIRVAVAWFTHHLLFEALMAKLEAKISIELVIINDHINNWEFGLPFKDFIDAGGQLYLTGPERIMHHKFCMIDDRVLCNGSYNWTYYAEERNQENYMFFYGAEELIQEFNQEFKNLITDMESVSAHMPPPFSAERYDLFSRRMYQSIDLQYKAKAKPIGQRQQAVRLLKEALTLYPENTEAKVLIEQWAPTDESIMKAQAVAQATAHIQQQIVQAQNVSGVTQPINKTSLALEMNTPNVTDLQAQLSVAQSLKHISYKGQRGKLRINLAWTTLDDLDLHVHLPDDQEISYRNKKITCQGFLGQLDLDANAGTPKIKNPQENIYWETGLPVGTYKVSVVHYSQNELARVPFAVSIIPEAGEATVLTATVEFSGTHKATVQVAKLNYTVENGLSIKSLLT